VAVADRVAVAVWQCVGWTGFDLGIILRGDFVKIGWILTEIWGQWQCLLDSGCLAVANGCWSGSGNVAVGRMDWKCDGDHFEG
jgi:hypothetical protein